MINNFTNEMKYRDGEIEGTIDLNQYYYKNRSQAASFVMMEYKSLNSYNIKIEVAYHHLTFFLMINTLNNRDLLLVYVLLLDVDTHLLSSNKNDEEVKPLFLFLVSFYYYLFMNL